MAITILQEFVDILYDVSTSLVGVKLDSSDLIGKRMCIVLVIISLLAKLINDKAKDLSDNVHELLLLLFPMLKITSRSSVDFVSDELEFVLKFINAEYHENVTKDLGFFAHHFCNRHKLNYPEWIYVLPIIHRFNNQEYPVLLEEKKINFSGKEDYIGFPVYRDLEDARILDMK